MQFKDKNSLCLLNKVEYKQFFMYCAVISHCHFSRMFIRIKPSKNFSHNDYENFSEMHKSWMHASTNGFFFFKTKFTYFPKEYASKVEGFGLFLVPAN